MTLSRTRYKRIPDWRDQSNYHYKQYRDLVTNNGLNPSLSVERTFGSDPSWGVAQPRGLQKTVDENHRLHRVRPLNVDADGDIGGYFNSTRRWTQFDNYRAYHIEFTGLSSGTWYHTIYDGPVVASAPISGTTVIPTPLQSNLDTMGTTAIARCKPTNNVASLGTSISEIFRDGLPKMFGSTTWEERTRLAHGAAGEYLNTEYGWLPLVSDIRSACYGLANAHRLMNSYESNAGKVVRRRYEFPVERTEVSSSSNVDADSFFTHTTMMDSSKPVPLQIKTTRTYKKTWFSGAFTYHLPLDYFSRGWLRDKQREAGYLLGIELTPDVVWNAAPWTWAIDWFSNMGDLVSNLSDWATDGMVLKYGYVMEHRFTTVTYSNSGPTRFRPYGSVYSSPVTYCYESKRREKATPFGFGLTWNGLSPRQLAITAALGITRVF